ncbi:MAG: deoxyguanosinetriphosphate triphosphohydrolase [Gammaproteobacteria bacterium]
MLPGAVTEGNSRGRRHAEPRAAYRNEFQRDRDRVIHCTAFRRLEYKTQVFLNHEGDMFRTRLTHSLEVAQIGRTIARALGVNEDLVEAIALAHDLGHTPFGHAGQDALDECMRAHGGFEHNLQSLRVVDLLEDRYLGFAGLNLTFEAREGILKKCSRAKAALIGEVASRFLAGTQPGLEAQIANVADEIAYNAHDVDDGLRSGLLQFDVIADLEPFRAALAGLPAHGQDREYLKRLAAEAIRRVIHAEVTDLIETTRERIRAAGIGDVGDVRVRHAPLVEFSAPVRSVHLALKRFLHAHLYRHARVEHMTHVASNVVRALFAAYMDDPARIPVARAHAEAEPPTGIARRIADYIAGMTDRFAFAEYERIAGAPALRDAGGFRP